MPERKHAVVITNFSKFIHLLHSPREANLPRQNDRTLIEGSSIFKAITVPAFSPPHSAAWAAGESRMGGNRPVIGRNTNVKFIPFKSSRASPYHRSHRRQHRWSLP